MKHTILDAQKLASQKSGECLSTEYINNIEKLTWRCSKGHTWSSSYASMLKNWCKFCNSESKKEKQKKIIKEFCEKVNIKCLNLDKYEKRSNVLQFCCIKNNHHWQTQWYNARLSNGCPKCLVYWTLEDAKRMAVEKNGECLSTVYERSDRDLVWKCFHGHILQSPLENIKNGQWCRTCHINSTRLGIEYAKTLAISKAGKCLSEVYVNSNSRLSWQCEFGHVWQATLSKVKNNRWCHICGVGKKQKTIKKIIEMIFPDKLIRENVRDIEWLKNPHTGMPLEIDIVVYNNDKSIYMAIEYDGRQHFEPVEKFGGQDAFVETLNRDSIKNVLLKNNSDKYKHFIRIDYKQEITIENIKKILGSFQ
jgi:hypothetical protein